MANSPSTTFPDLSLPQVSVFAEYGINDRQVEALVPLISQAYDIGVISKISQQLSKPQLIESATPTFEIYRKPLSWASATIAARDKDTISGSLILGWSDPTFSFIPVGNTVIAKSGCVGIVTAKSAGTATIGFFSNANGNTSFVLSDFKLGEMASDNGDVTDRYNRTTKETRYTMPVNYKNIVSSISDSCTIYAADVKQKTYLSSVGGKQYYALNKIVEMLARVQHTDSVRMYRNTPAVFNQSTPMGASFINQILTMGGTGRPITASVTRSEFEAAIKEYVLKGGYASNEITIIAGTSYIADLQSNVFYGFVNTAGTNNVLGGQVVKGLNIFTYSYLGFTINMIHEPLFDNPNIFNASALFAGETTMSKSAIWINTAPPKTVQGVTLPFVQDYYYIASDMIVSERDGLTDMNGNPTKKNTNPSLAATVEVNWNKTTQLTNPAGCFFHYASA